MSRSIAASTEMMLTIPDHFQPSLALTLHGDSIAHLFVGDDLIQAIEQPNGLAWRTWQALGFEASRVYPLGHLDGREHVGIALPGDYDVERIPAGFRAGGLRSWFGLLDDATLAIAMRAVQVLAWDRTHRFCGGCGEPTVSASHERMRSCPRCNLAVYPRISPAMMVLVTRGRQLLLGRGVNFPAGFYSALAGFVEAGETIEQTVHREVMEEVGLRVRNLRYFASQSWPFPNSLMIAFNAEYDGGDLRIDPAELVDAQWFEPEELPRMPPRFSIARALIDATLADLGPAR